MESEMRWSKVWCGECDEMRWSKVNYGEWGEYEVKCSMESEVNMK